MHPVTGCPNGGRLSERGVGALTHAPIHTPIHNTPHRIHSGVIRASRPQGGRTPVQTVTRTRLGQELAPRSAPAKPQAVALRRPGISSHEHGREHLG
ncbi:Uncharacterised protein [Actinomyces bovis]|uniref:Uncharacterized protein n=1 Tax=Actinomyces bovis TaxID=1658 RepID=A0ABY1VLA3_9ACTO|nr:Uncharacterised protein [Actinomyces bovis]VEG54288.1 Uncharacterised protein [Actinomyces israelii]